MNSYWEKRKAQRMYEAMEDAEKAAAEISKAYSSASSYLNSQIEGIFDRYRRKYKLSEKEARRLLNEAMDGPTYDEMVKALKKGVSSKEKEELLKELEAPAYRYRINRFQNLQNQIDDMMVNVYQQEKDISTSHYIATMYDGYYKSVYDIQHNTGLGFSFSSIDPEQVNRILNSKWSGENYSARIWGNTQEVVKKLKEEMLVGVMTGKTESEMAKELAYRFQVGAFEARRLVRTESNFAYTQAEMLSYEECECDTYVFLATLDLITSQICRSLDMKRFKLKDQQPGKNCPPMHPFCRSTTIAGLDDQVLAKLERRARDSETGKTYTVPGNMSYSEWMKQQQDKHGKDTVDILQKKFQNRSADKKQMQRYKDVLGSKYVPDSLDKFQDMKYNDVEKYKDVKGYYLFKRNNPDSTYNDYLLNEIKIFAPGTPGRPERINAYALKDTKAKENNQNHLFERMLERNITADELQEYIDNAKVMFSQWSGKRRLYISPQGAAIVTQRENDWILKTGFKHTDYGEDYMHILEVLKKWEE